MVHYNLRYVLACLMAVASTVFTLKILRLGSDNYIQAVAPIPQTHVFDDAYFEIDQLYTNVETGEIYHGNKALNPMPMIFPDFGPDEDPRQVWDKRQGEGNELVDLEHEKYAKLQDGHSIYNNDKIFLLNNKILILSGSDGKGNTQIKDIVRLIMHNRQEYANMHGYINYFVDMSQFNIRNTSPVWGKIPAIIKASNENPQVDWIWWVDLDVIITNPYIDLYNYLLDPEALNKKMAWGHPLKYHGKDAYKRGKYFANATEANMDIERDINLIISQDSNGINAGSFFIKNTPWTKQILIELWKNPYFMTAKTKLQEQEILKSLILDHKRLTLRYVGFVTQHVINSYSGFHRNAWKPNDFVVHLAGVGGDQLRLQWNKYYNLRMRVPEEFRIPDDHSWTFASH